MENSVIFFILSVVLLVAFGLGVLISFLLTKVKNNLDLTKRLDRLKPEKSDPLAVQANLTTAKIIDKKRRKLDTTLGNYIPTLGSMRRKFRVAGLPITLGVYVGILLILAALLTFAPIDFVEKPPETVEEYSVVKTGSRLDQLNAESQDSVRSAFTYKTWIYQLYLFMKPLSAVMLVHFLLNNFVLTFLADLRRQKIVSQMPNFLDFLNRSVTIGVPVDAALKDALAEADKPLKEELARVVHLAAIGTPLDRSLRTVADEIEVREFDFFAIATVVQLESGGNLGQALANLSNTIRERHQMQLKVKALASEGKLSAWFLGLMPFFLMIAFHFTNPQYMEPMFFDPRGHDLMMITLGIMAVGAYIMAKIVKIRI